MAGRNWAVPLAGKLFLFGCLVGNLVGPSHALYNYSDHEIKGSFGHYDDSKRFEFRLLEDYDARFAPPDPPLIVIAKPELISVTQFDEQAETVSYYLYMRFNWTDPRLSWSPKDSNLSKVWLPEKSVWKPDMVIHKMVHLYYPAKYQPPMKVLVHKEGSVQWQFPIVATVANLFDFHELPYDEQTCNVTIVSWQNGEQYIALEAAVDKMLTDNYNTNNEWDLVGNTVYEERVKYACCKDSYSNLRYELVFRRKPNYYLVYLVVPTFLLSFVSIVGIFTPSSSGLQRDEKVTLGITAILTISVFLTIVADQTPKIAEYIPVLGRFFLYTIIIVSTATVWSVVAIGLERCAVHNRPFPKWLKCFTGSSSCRKKIKQSQPQANNHVMTEPANLNTNGTSRYLANIYETITEIRNNLGDDDAIIANDWHIFAYRLDMVGLLLHLMGLMAVTFLWYPQWWLRR